MGHHLGHFGVQTLAHLGATVIDQDRAIGINMDQGARLVEVRHIE